jgi:basic amino acid/polyamine antiporter, APA family
VCISVLIMRYTNPKAERPFRAPLGNVVPILGIAFCLLLMFSLPAQNWLRLFVWLAVGFVIYFGYGRFHSALALRHAELLAGPGAVAAETVAAVDDPPAGQRKP